MPHHATYAVPNEQLDVVVIDDSKNMQGIVRPMLNAMKVRRVRLFDCAPRPPCMACGCTSRRISSSANGGAGLVSGHQLLRMVRARFMEYASLRSGHHPDGDADTRHHRQGATPAPTRSSSKSSRSPRQFSRADRLAAA